MSQKGGPFLNMIGAQQEQIINKKLKPHQQK